MWIKEPSSPPQDRERHRSKKAIMPAAGMVLTGNVATHFEIVTRVNDRIFFGSPSQFKAAQPFVTARGAPKCQLGKLILSEPFDCFPHPEIHPSKLLVTFVRSAEFVDCFAPKVQKDEGRHWFQPVTRNRDKSLLTHQ